MGDKPETKILYKISDLPNKPAVYALYGGKEGGEYVAYVGSTKTLKNRMIQHLVNRDSTIAMGTTAVGMNPDYVTRVRWWVLEDFTKPMLEAAELIAFDELDPALRSRGAAKGLYGNEQFRDGIRKRFQSDASGCLIVPSLLNLILRVEKLEKYVEDLK